jgi:hypothetical protein
LVDNLSDGDHDITIKQTDIAGNVSAESAALEITVDNTAPIAPTFDWHEDTTDGDTAGADSDDVSYDNTIDVTLNETDAGAYWEYSTDGGATWTEVKDGSTSFELADNTVYAVDDIQVREVDAAGNTGDAATNSVTMTTDNTADVDNNLGVVIHDDDATVGNDGYINATEAGSLKYTISGVDTDVNDSLDTKLVISDEDGNTVELTGTDVTNGDHTVDISALNDGNITAYFVVEDKAGNTKQVDATFDGGDTSSTKDTVGPNLDHVYFSSQVHPENDITGHNILGSNGENGPGDDFEGAEIYDDVVFVFDEDVLVPTNAIVIDDTTDSAEWVHNDSDMSGSEISLNPSINGDDEDSYTYTLDGDDNSGDGQDGITDLAGNYLNDQTGSFII